jgi:hypothetical protein
VQDYRIYLNRHLAPHFGDRDLDKIDPDDVVSYMAAKCRKGSHRRRFKAT